MTTIRSDAAWRRSARCETAQCVEIKTEGGARVLMRHSESPGGQVLAFSAAEWNAFLRRVRAGEVPYRG